MLSGQADLLTFYDSMEMGEQCLALYVKTLLIPCTSEFPCTDWPPWREILSNWVSFDWLLKFVIIWPLFFMGKIQGTVRFCPALALSWFTWLHVQRKCKTYFLFLNGHFAAPFQYIVTLQGHFLHNTMSLKLI